MDQVMHVSSFPVQNGDKTVDIYEMRSEADLNKVLHKRRKKLRRQKQDNNDVINDDVTLSVTDQLPLLATVKMDAKIK